MAKPKRWMYGVTTTPTREEDLFPRTLASLKNAGFDNPWLFIDGCDDRQGRIHPAQGFRRQQADKTGYHRDKNGEDYQIA